MNCRYTGRLSGAFLLLLLLGVWGCKREAKVPEVSVIETDRSNGVSVYDSLRCQNGITVNTGYHFIDMHGNVVKLRPATLCVTLDEYRYFGITPDDKFALFYNDTIVWKLAINVHHTAFLDEDSNVVVLAMELQPFKGNAYRYFEVLYTINQQGEILRTQNFSKLVDQIQRYLPEPRDSILEKNKDFVSAHFPAHKRLFDSSYFHINSVQIIPPNKSELIDTAFANGHLLISDFMNNFIAIVDRNTLDIRWIYNQKNSRMGQHAASMLPDGRITFFVNNIPKADGGYYSAVQILNPITQKIEWQYTGTPAYSMHSITQGCCQYLKNGNILITINNRITDGIGYVIEVTPQGQVVWKWTPPNYKELSGNAEGFFKVLRQQD